MEKHIFTILIAFLSSIFLLSSCGGGTNSSAPAPAPVVNTTTDPTGDTLGIGGASVNYDITSIKTIRTGSVGATTYDKLTIAITFAQAVSIPSAGNFNGPSDLYGIIAIDADKDSSTGLPSSEYNGGICGSTPLGQELKIDLVNGRRASGGGYQIIDNTPAHVGEATPSASGNTLTLVVPLSELGGDDGETDLGIVIGDEHGRTDCAPGAGTTLHPTVISLEGLNPW